MGTEESMTDKITELRTHLANLRARLVPEKQIYALIHKFGHERFLEAKPDVEELL